MPRIATPLTPEQKEQIEKMHADGMSINKISKELHILNTRISEHLKSIKQNRKSGTGGGRLKTEKKNDRMVENLKCFARLGMGIPDMVKFTGLDRDTIKRILKENNIKLDSEILAECTSPSEGPQYDLTLRTKEENEEIVKYIKVLLGDWAKYVTFQIHSDLTIGGNWSYYVGGKKVNKGYYEPENHKFDIVIPEIQRVVLPVKEDERATWKVKTGGKPAPDGIGTWFNFMLVAVSKYDIIDAVPDDVVRMAMYIKMRIQDLHLQTKYKEPEKFQSCTDCKYKEECNHTGCKARNIPYTNNEPSDSDDRVTLNLKACMDDASEAIRELNGEEYKYWDEKNRIGNHGGPRLSDDELVQATGYRKEYELQVDLKARVDAVKKVPRRNLETGGWD